MIEEIKALEASGVLPRRLRRRDGELLKQFARGRPGGLVDGQRLGNRPAGPGWPAAPLENLVYPQPRSSIPTPTSPPWPSSSEAFRAKYNREPDIYAAHGYDSLKLIVQAMTRHRVRLPGRGQDAGSGTSRASRTTPAPPAGRSSTSGETSCATPDLRDQRGQADLPSSGSSRKAASCHIPQMTG